MRYQVAVEDKAHGAFVAYCGLLPQCVSQGTSAADAIAHVKKAIITPRKPRERGPNEVSSTRL